MEDLIDKWAELTFNEVNQERKINLLSKFLTKYHPAGYSSKYSAGSKFASRIFGSNNTFTYNPENKALW